MGFVVGISGLSEGALEMGLGLLMSGRQPPPWLVSAAVSLG